MNPHLSTEQVQLLLETAAGSLEPATRRVLAELHRLSRLGLLSFDGGGRYELTPAGHERLAIQAPLLH